jgi:hypothetical protein
MLHRLPRRLPPLGVLLDDIGRPHPSSLAAALDVDVRTVRRWLKADTAPRPVLLALYWLTRWGCSDIDAELHNRAATFALLADAQSRELTRIRLELSELRARLSTTPGRIHVAPHAAPRHHLNDGFNAGQAPFVQHRPAQQGHESGRRDELPHRPNLHLVHTTAAGGPPPSRLNTATTPAAMLAHALASAPLVAISCATP